MCLMGLLKDDDDNNDMLLMRRLTGLLSRLRWVPGGRYPGGVRLEGRVSPKDDLPLRAI